MFEPSNRRSASITLCLFPHLMEFIAIDTRKDLPGGGAVRLMRFQDVFTDEFRTAVEARFSQLLRRENAGLTEMIALPQEVETLVRAESMKRIIGNLNRAAGTRSAGIDGGVGVLFFARGLLSIETGQLEAAMKDLFGSVLSDEQLSHLHLELERLIAAEQAAEDTVRQREMAQLITGDPASFMTLWQNSREN